MLQHSKLGTPFTECSFDAPKSNLHLPSISHGFLPQDEPNWVMFSWTAGCPLLVLIFFLTPSFPSQSYLVSQGAYKRHFSKQRWLPAPSALS